MQNATHPDRTLEALEERIAELEAELRRTKESLNALSDVVIRHHDHPEYLPKKDFDTAVRIGISRR
jgi:uncharacterized coiled-coil protein SlyX